MTPAEEILQANDAVLDYVRTYNQKKGLIQAMHALQEEVKKDRPGVSLEYTAGLLAGVVIINALIGDDENMVDDPAREVFL